MKRIRLRFAAIQQIVGAEGLAVIILTDESRQRALSVVCDEAMRTQIFFRLSGKDVSRTFLPEALLHFIDTDMELMVYGLYEGQYQVILAGSDYEQTVRLRMSDAVLLTLINPEIPLYIEDGLMQRQSVEYDPQATGIAIPINTMDSHRLNEALQHAIEVENYELASLLRDELKKRTPK